MPSPRDAHKALRLLKTSVSRTVPQSATGGADLTSIRVGFGQHRWSGTVPRADRAGENEEKVTTKAERLIALFRNNANASASPVVARLRERELLTGVGRDAVAEKRIRLRKHEVFQVKKIWKDEDQSSNIRAQAESPKAKARSHTLVRRHRSSKITQPQTVIRPRLPNRDGVRIRRLDTQDRSTHEEGNQEIQHHALKARRVRTYEALDTAPRAKTSTPTDRRRTIVQYRSPKDTYRAMIGARNPDQGELPIRRLDSQYHPTHEETNSEIRYHGAKGQNINVQYHAAKNAEVQDHAAKDLNIQYHKVKDRKVQDQILGRDSDGPKYRPFPVSEDPVKLTFPKLDLFLIDDFKPVLKMLCEATTDIPVKRKTAQVDVDGEHWQDSESDANSSMDGVGDLMDDITYAPSTEAARIRTTWTGTSDSALQPRPKQWTQQNLAGYVGRFLASAVRAAESYPTGIAANTYRNAATQKVTTLLTDDKLVPYITPSALNMALIHLCREKAFEDVFRIYRYLKGQSFSFSSNGFNVLLYAAAWEDRPMNFKPVLQHMLDSSFLPTGQTWFTFYQLISRKYPKERKKVLLAMRKKGLLQGGENIKQALIVALGWTDKSESDIRTPA